MIYLFHMMIFHSLPVTTPKPRSYSTHPFFGPKHVVPSPTFLPWYGFICGCFFFNGEVFIADHSLDIGTWDERSKNGKFQEWESYGILADQRIVHYGKSTSSLNDHPCRNQTRPVLENPLV